MRVFLFKWILGGMSEKIAAPRRDTPRTAVPEGSVGIAGMQTGVYPLETPGGWQLIGRTPLKLFDAESKDKTLLKCGDIIIKEDTILEFGPCLKGCRTYIAVCGGFDIKPVMGSVSTYLRGKLGGVEGRALQKGDVLSIKPKNEAGENIIKKLITNSKDTYNYSEFCAPHWYIRNYADYGESKSEYRVIRAFEDRQYKNFGDGALEKFWNSEFVIDTKSDRMGYRLKGAEIIMEEKIEMISGEVSFGTIQIPPDGNPIILLADRATAGGYPKIAHVCDYDIQKLVQIKPGERIKFKKIDIKDAEKLYIERLKEIEELKKSIELITY